MTFADLGLIVVDEEQRFGVAHKERLKALRKNVDVLTLTATPIPRTLHMALASLREISVIESPPEQRLAVKTYVTTYDDGIVRDAVRSELARGGQVYFLHNRVQTIYTWQRRLQELLPDVEMLVAHGQMPPAELEDVMYRFARGDAQVLMATAIIENGLDIPNVNTIIVNDAWQFGLAQLYQLRGRVGRAAAQAYAYFMYQKGHTLTEQAQKRMQTILEASDLGAGFRIAMRDLEIRGAGNLLGAEQHGHMSAIGFDLYSRMLAEAVDRLRGDTPEPEPPAAVVDLPLDAFLPDAYMGSYATKVREYQRLARLRGIDEVEAAIADIRDRFGELPKPVDNLAYLLRIKARAQALGFSAVTTYGRELIIKAPAEFVPSSVVMLKAARWGVKRGQAGLVWPDFARDAQWEGQTHGVARRPRTLGCTGAGIVGASAIVPSHPQGKETQHDMAARKRAETKTAGTNAAKSLVVVESNAKAATLQRFPGAEVQGCSVGGPCARPSSQRCPDTKEPKGEELGDAGGQRG